MDFKQLLGNILTAAKAIAPMVVPGAAPALAAAEAIVKAIDNIRGSGQLTPADNAAAGETRAMLEARVHAHASSVAESLKG